MTYVLAQSDSGLAAFGALFFLVIGLAGIAFYFIPTIIAFARNKTNKVAILALNTLLGWSFIGWVVSLVWALSADPVPVLVQQTFQGYGPQGYAPQGSVPPTYSPPPPPTTSGVLPPPPGSIVPPNDV
jgi:hypothetical protein